jgi:hypothetical protein
MKECIPLKYQCLDRFTEIYSNCKEKNTRSLLQDLKELINYQMTEITNQRSQIVAIKHKYAWRNYDKPFVNEKPIDKPPKSGNMSC